MSSTLEICCEPLGRDFAKCHLCRLERGLTVVYTYFICDHHTYLREKRRNAQKSAFKEMGK